MKNLKINMAVCSLKTCVHSLKSAINTTHKIPKSNNQNSFITLDITFHITLDITLQVCL